MELSRLATTIRIETIAAARPKIFNIERLRIDRPKSLFRLYALIKTHILTMNAAEILAKETTVKKLLCSGRYWLPWNTIAATARKIKTKNGVGYFENMLEERPYCAHVSRKSDC
jgi:hypothetical protein